jgi:hypothetical protein
MSTATAEKPKAEAPKVEETPPPFSMPKVRVGQQVRFYRYGEINDQHPPEIAFVIKSGRNVLTLLKTIDGFPRQSVLHINDPRLKNTDQRENGAWDYIEDEIEQKRLNADLLARVTALEEALKSKK